MKILRNVEKSTTIENFAEKYNLTMIINRWESSRYTASFDDVEVEEGNLLGSEYGVGLNEDDAINDYAQLISNKIIVVGAYTKHREIIQVPILI